jgi:hypothetical protein
VVYGVQWNFQGWVEVECCWVFWGMWAIGRQFLNPLVPGLRFCQGIEIPSMHWEWNLERGDFVNESKEVRLIQYSTVLRMI